MFTPGRWECIDYKNGASTCGGPVNFSIGGDNQTIEFDKSSASQTPLPTQMIVPITNVEGIYNLHQTQQTANVAGFF